jgi:hypothetical protein
MAKSNKSIVNNTTNNVLSMGGVSMERGRGFRARITVGSVRRSTGYFKTRIAAVRALNRLRRELLTEL